MGLITSKMPNGEAIGAGQTAIFKLSKGATYHVLQLRLKHGSPLADATKADFANLIDRLRLKVDGKLKWDVNGEYLTMRNDFYQRVFKDGVLSIFLSTPWARSIDGEDEYAWGTADIQSLTLEIDLASNIVNPSLEVYAQQGANKPFGKHIAILEFNETNAVAGKVEIPDIAKGPYSLSAMHIKRSDIEEFEIAINRVTLMEGDKAIHEATCMDRRDFQAGWFHVDPTHRNRILDLMPLNVTDFRLKLVTTGQGAMPIYVERVEGIA